MKLGQGRMSRPVSFFLAGVFSFLLLSVPCLQIVYEVQSGKETAITGVRLSHIRFLLPSFDKLDEINTFLDLFSFLPTSYEIQRYEQGIEDNSLLVKTLLPPIQSLFSSILGKGNEKAYIGKSGWFFYKPDIDYLVNPGFLEPDVLKQRQRKVIQGRDKLHPDPFKAILHFKKELEQRNIKLVVLPVPGKSAVHPEKLTDSYDASAKVLHNQSFETLVRRLNIEGVGVINLDKLFMKEKMKGASTFLKKDSHWTPEMARTAAHTVSDWLIAYGILSKGTIPFNHRQHKVSNSGDITRMLQLPENQKRFRDESVVVKSVLRADGDPVSWHNDSRILVLGDSFCNIFSLEKMGWGRAAGFVEQLGFYLRQPVDRIVINDNGAFASRLRLSNDLKHGDDRLKGKEVVIFQFAERELSFGDWRIIEIELDQTKIQTAENEKEEAETLISGIVSDFAYPPRPGSVPYRDALVALYFKEVRGVNTFFGNKEIIVYTWGLQDNHLVNVPFLQRGKRLQLSVVPWKKVENRYGSLNRVEIPDEKLIDLDLYWHVSASERKDHDYADPVTLRRDIAGGGEGNGILGKISNNIPNGVQNNQIIKEARKLSKELEAKQKTVFSGKNGWLFFGPEIRHIGAAQFWGEKVNHADGNADPLPAILDFKSQLSSVGVELIIVPVPAKAFVYPEKWIPEPRKSKVDHNREDVFHQQFYKILEANGIVVVDLMDQFLASKRANQKKLFLQQDTHWTPHGIELAAREVARVISKRSWYQRLFKEPFSIRKETIKIQGNLCKMLGDTCSSTESVEVKRVIRKGPQNGGTLSNTDRKSPILLMSDSFGLVFHAGGDMHASNAGLSDILSSKLGIPLDVIGVRGSGATAARINLARRRDNLAGKKVIIWCFSIHEFTEAINGWRKVPVVRP